MSEKELTDLIERIKERRLELEMSYQDLSDATGISKSTLQRYETGYIKKVPINQIEILAKALHTTPSYLMGWEEPASCNSSSVPALSLTQQEEKLIKKYRQLSDVRRYVVNEVLDAQYQKQMEEQSAEKEERRLG